MAKSKNQISDSDLLQVVSEATSGMTGHDFLVEVAKCITSSMGMRYCFIAECANEAKTRLRTVVFMEGEKLLDNLEYNVNDSGCQMMMNGDTFFLPEGVYKKFAGAIGIEAYVGAPIISPTTGEILGHIAATHTSPVGPEKDQTAVLKIFAARIAAEFERMKAERELEKTNKELRRRLNEIELYNTTIRNLRDQVYWVDSNGKFIRVNDAVIRQTGFTEEELLQMTVFDLNPTLTQKEWELGWEAARQHKHELIETVHQCKDGHQYPVEVNNIFLEHDGEEFFAQR